MTSSEVFELSKGESVIEKFSPTIDAAYLKAMIKHPVAFIFSILLLWGVISRLFVMATSTSGSIDLIPFIYLIILSFLYSYLRKNVNEEKKYLRTIHYILTTKRFVIVGPEPDAIKAIDYQKLSPWIKMQSPLHKLLGKYYLVTSPTSSLVSPQTSKFDWDALKTYTKNLERIDYLSLKQAVFLLSHFNKLHDSDSVVIDKNEQVASAELPADQLPSHEYDKKDSVISHKKNDDVIQYRRKRK
jgi:hypothetical protein